MHLPEIALSKGPVLLLGSAPNPPCQARRQQLRRAGFTVRWILDTFSLVQGIEELRPILVLVNAPSVRRSGTAICRKIRDAVSSDNMRLVVLGPEISEPALVEWLECGADDYIADGVGAIEFLSRVRAILRGVGSQTSVWSSSAAPSKNVTAGDVELDPCGMRLLVRGREVAITSLEFRLLQFAVQHHGKVFTRNELLKIVWRDDNSRTSRTVDACIRRIRQKIQAAGGQSIRLTTIRGVGYRLDRSAPPTSLRGSAWDHQGTLVTEEIA